VLITGNVQIDNTISALRGGAYDFIGKPIKLEELRVTIHNAIEAHYLSREVEQVRKEREREFNFRQLVGESPAMKKMLGLAAKVAESDVVSVLLQGESGTGKDGFDASRVRSCTWRRSVPPAVSQVVLTTSNRDF
jgi:DNA-binding NtrC family response regulator